VDDKGRDRWMLSTINPPFSGHHVSLPADDTGRRKKEGNEIVRAIKKEKKKDKIRNKDANIPNGL
jgi:hypothetical protein